MSALAWLCFIVGVAVVLIGVAGVWAACRAAALADAREAREPFTSWDALEDLGPDVGWSFDARTRRFTGRGW
jgi:hypothetical protein